MSTVGRTGPRTQRGAQPPRAREANPRPRSALCPSWPCGVRDTGKRMGARDRRRSNINYNSSLTFSPHRRHVALQFRVMKRAVQPSGARAMLSQSLNRSTQSSGGVDAWTRGCDGAVEHTLQLRRHSDFMKLGFFLHSPCPTHVSHLMSSSEQASCPALPSSGASHHPHARRHVTAMKRRLRTQWSSLAHASHLPDESLHEGSTVVEAPAAAGAA